MASLSFSLVPHVNCLLMASLDVLNELISRCWWKLLNDSAWIFYLEETMARNNDQADKSVFLNLSGSIELPIISGAWVTCLRERC